MGHKFNSMIGLIFGCVLATGAAQAASGSAFFGVGLTVQAAKPATLPGVIIRNAVYTPGAVAIGLNAAGYAQVSLVSRNESGYIFSAVSRSNGQRYLLTVAAWRGEIVSAVRG